MQHAPIVPEDLCGGRVHFPEILGMAVAAMRRMDDRHRRPLWPMTIPAAPSICSAVSEAHGICLRHARSDQARRLSRRPVSAERRFFMEGW